MVKIDKQKCVGCGACVSICPEAFEMKDGKAEVKSQDADCIDEAIDSCPVQAISK
ncbi:ferredoxin [Candidatus Pacearchaeota archaeon]|nr:MAG: ferredoxin [Candidatus Pacearchaeota archaeon]